MVPGQGNIKWNNFSKAIESLNNEPMIVFEVENYKDLVESIEYFKKKSLYPFS